MSIEVIFHLSVSHSQMCFLRTRFPVLVLGGRWPVFLSQRPNTACRISFWCLFKQSLTYWPILNWVSTYMTSPEWYTNYCLLSHSDLNHLSLDSTQEGTSRVVTEQDSGGPFRGTTKTNQHLAAYPKSSPQIKTGVVQGSIILWIEHCGDSVLPMLSYNM